MACPRKEAWLWSRGSGSIVDEMSTEERIDLGGRKWRTSIWYVLGREHRYSREELVDEQMVCPRKES